MKTNRFALMIAIFALLLPAHFAEAKGTTAGEGTDGARRQHLLRNTEVKDDGQSLTYGDFGQILYNLVYEEENTEIQKMAKDRKEGEGLSWLKAFSLAKDDISAEDPVSRIEGIYVLYGLFNRLSETPDIKQDPNFDFKDYEKIEIPYKIPLAWVQREGLFIGNGKGEIQPDAPLTANDLSHVLRRGEALYKGKNIVRPVYFNAYEIEKIEVESARKLGVKMVYTGADYIDAMREIVNGYRGSATYAPSDGWEDRITVYTAAGGHFSYEVAGDVLVHRGMVTKDRANEKSYAALREYLMP